MRYLFKRRTIHLSVLIYLLVLFNTSIITWAQNPTGTVVIDLIHSKHLENNFGEIPTREVSVYLPPGYRNTDQRYPVIYFLHGFMADHKILEGMTGILDFALDTRKIRPFIMVLPNQKTTYDGSFYSNSGVFGDWEDFSTYDLVEYMDKNYRTLARKESRGITGHSMGGYGAIKIAMHHPEIFSCVYALSPGALAIVREYGPNSDTYKELSTIETEEELGKTYFGKVVIAFAKSWSPNPENPSFFCNIPFQYRGEELIVKKDVLKKWYANMPFYMIDDNLDNLRKLKAIKLDWGRNAGERFTIQCSMFSQRLENAGVKHFAEEYIGTHVDGIYTKEGRIPNQMLPFFDSHLDFKLYFNVVWDVVENVKKKLSKDREFRNRVNELSKKLINSQTETLLFFSGHAFAKGASINLLIGRVAERYLYTIGGRRGGRSVADAAINVLSNRPEVWEQLLDISLKDMDPWEDPARTLDILILKGNAIAESIMDTLGREKTGRLLSALREKHKGQSYTYDDILAADKVLGYNLEQLMGNWIDNTKLPGFVVQSNDVYRLPDGSDGNPRYQILIFVRNDEPASGVFRFRFFYPPERQGGGQRETLGVNSEPVYMAGKSAVRFGTVVSEPPYFIFLVPYLSLNRVMFYIPFSLYDPEKMEEKEPVDGLEEFPWSLPKEDFIIVDDLDPGFKVLEGEQRYGLRLNSRGTGSEETDQGLPVESSNTWSRKTTTTNWGKYRRTMAMINAGKGDNKAVFTTHIPHAGLWDLELHLPNNYFRGSKLGTWNLVVKDSNGDPHEIQFDFSAATFIDWNLVSTLDLPEGETSVTLFDKTDGDFVIADAIRWSPLEKNEGK
jgi:pimeloyl-ACP methyl ester carboxylesterase